jgi:hypothetical protein
MNTLSITLGVYPNDYLKGYTPPKVTQEGYKVTTCRTAYDLTTTELELYYSFPDNEPMIEKYLSLFMKSVINRLTKAIDQNPQPTDTTPLATFQTNKEFYHEFFKIHHLFIQAMAFIALDKYRGCPETKWDPILSKLDDLYIKFYNQNPDYHHFDPIEIDIRQITLDTYVASRTE